MSKHARTHTLPLINAHTCTLCRIGMNACAHPHGTSSREARVLCFSDPNAMTTIVKERVSGTMRFVLDSLHLVFYHPRVHSYMQERDLVLNSLIAADFERFINTRNQMYISHLPFAIRWYLGGQSEMTQELHDEFREYYDAITSGNECVVPPHRKSVLWRYWRERRDAAKDKGTEEEKEQEVVGEKKRTRKGMSYTRSAYSRVRA